MGNDGGTIPSRRDLVTEDPGELTTAQIFEQKQLNGDATWRLCGFTGKQLKDHIVSDYKGLLYNKESLLEYLLAPKDYEYQQRDRIKHITSLKDFVELKITTASDDGKWQCPISKKETGKFVYIVECGHVFSESALKNIEETNCLVCNVPFDSTNIIAVNPTDAKEVKRLQSRIDKLKDEGLTHSLQKAKKPKTSGKKRKPTKSSKENEEPPNPSAKAQKVN